MRTHSTAYRVGRQGLVLPQPHITNADLCTHWHTNERQVQRDGVRRGWLWQQHCCARVARCRRHFVDDVIFVIGLARRAGSVPDAPGAWGASIESKKLARFFLVAPVVAGRHAAHVAATPDQFAFVDTELATEKRLDSSGQRSRWGRGHWLPIEQPDGHGTVMEWPGVDSVEVRIDILDAPIAPKRHIAGR